MEIQTHAAPQNDHLNLSFVKGTYVDGEKWLKLVVKWSFMSRKFCATVSNCSHWASDNLHKVEFAASVYYNSAKREKIK